MLFISLASFFFILVFTTLYVGKGMEKKPEFLAQAVRKIEDNLETLALYGCPFGVVAAILSIVFGAGGLEIVIATLANVLIVVMTLPYALDQLLGKMGGKVNAAITESLRETVATIGKHEKNIGYAAAVVTLLYFAVLFR